MQVLKEPLSRCFDHLGFSRPMLIVPRTPIDEPPSFFLIRDDASLYFTAAGLEAFGQRDIVPTKFCVQTDLEDLSRSWHVDLLGQRALLHVIEEGAM